MRRLKIAFDISQIGRRKAGCGFYAAALINGLLAKEPLDEFTLLTSFGDFFHDPIQAVAFPHINKGVHYGPRHLRKKDAQRFWNDRELGGRLLERFEVVHANNFWCPPWPLPGKLIYTLYDMSFIEHPEWTPDKNRIGCLNGVKRAAIYADEFVSISEATKRAFLHYFPSVSPERVHVIYPASRFGQPGFTPKPRQPRRKGFDPNQPFLLSTGTLEPRKNQIFLLDAYEQFRERRATDVALVFTGKRGWLMDGFKKRIDESPYARDIHILGYVSDGELMWLYQHCLANLYPSHYEGFGLPVLEGMSFGAPTICSDQTSMPEVVKNAGILLSPKDREGWVHAFESAAMSTTRSRVHSEAAIKQAASFNWGTSAEQMQQLYHGNSR